MPPFNKSGMDGFAIKSNDKSETFEIIEDKSALVTLKGLINISFNRYKNDDKLNGNKIIIPEGGYVDFENNLGITKIFRIGNRWSETYELVR